MPEASAPRITAVVCSYNGASTLDACLDALERQTVADRAQVVVVDDGSTDATPGIARRHGVELVVHPENRGLSAARNSGVARARAPVVAFTDDDCIPEPSWLEGLLAAHARPGVVAAGGPVEIARVQTLVHRYLADHPPIAPLELDLARHTSLPARLALYARGMWRPARLGHARAVYSFPGANMSFTRDVLEAVGGFDPAMTFGSDDEYLCGQVRARFPDSLLWFEPAAVVRHDYAGTLLDLLRRSYAYGRGHARVFLRDPDQRWPIVFPLPIALVGATLALRRRGLLALPLLVHGAYPQGILGVRRNRRVADLAFSWLRLAEELAHDAGMLAGLAAGGWRRAAGGAKGAGR